MNHQAPAVIMATRSDSEVTNEITATTGNNIETTNELDSRIQSLAQELQDTILSFTDGFHIPATVAIAESYRPPVALQLNRKLRAKFAKEYYGGATFVAIVNSKEELHHFFRGGNHMRGGNHDYHKWLRSLGAASLESMRNIEVQLPGRWAMFWEYDGRYIRETLISNGTALYQARLAVTYVGQYPAAWVRKFDERGVSLDGNAEDETSLPERVILETSEIQRREAQSKLSEGE